MRTTLRILGAAATCTLLVACSGGTTTKASARSQAEQQVKQFLATTPPRPLSPFPLRQRIGLGDWEMTVESASLGSEVRVLLRMINAHSKSARLDTTGLFTLRDGVGGQDLAANSVTGLEGPVASGASAATTVTFRPAVPFSLPMLVFNGERAGLQQAAVALTPAGVATPAE